MQTMAIEVEAKVREMSVFGSFSMKTPFSRQGKLIWSDSVLSSALSLASELFVSITVTAHGVEAFFPLLELFFQLNFQVKTSLLSNSKTSGKKQDLFTILKIHWTITAFTCNVFEHRVPWLLAASNANLFSVYAKRMVFAGIDSKTSFLLN